MNAINKNTKEDIIAIIPAAGRASRLPGIHCSKEIYPVGYLDEQTRPEESVEAAFDKPVCFYLFEKLARAGVKKAVMVIREEKWDIPQTLGNGSQFGMDIAYQMLALPYGTAYTIDQAWSFAKNSVVAIGFPDILFAPDDAYENILAALHDSGADIMLGLFPADRPHKVDMVHVDPQHNVTDIIIKPQTTQLTLTWGIAVWKPTFSAFLHEFLAGHTRHESDPELFIGDVIQAGIVHGLTVKALQVSDQAYLDIGTPDDLQRALTRYG